MFAALSAAKRCLLGVLAVVLFAALAVPAGLAVDGSGPSASGHANLLIADEKQTFSFHVQQMPDGTYEGTFQVKSRGQEITAHGVLDCLRIVGNTAHVSGVITKSDGLGGLTYVLFTVVDNGEGANAPPDLWSDVFIFGAPVSCNVAALPPVNPVDEGDFQVKP
jgi:hypothetical protein